MFHQIDEIIEMPQLDLANLTLEKTLFLQEVLEKKKMQEQINRELKKKKVLYDEKNIFVDAFDIQNFDEDATIINQLVTIVDQVNDGNMESNKKLMEWSTRRFETKVVNKVSITIDKKKVQLKERV